MSSPAFAARRAREAHVMILRETEPMTSLFRARPKPFLDDVRRDWQFETFAWLLRHCGGYGAFLETMTVLPVEQHFPDHGMTGHAGVAALFRQVRDHAGMADWPCMVEPRRGDDDTRPPAAESRTIRVIDYEPARCQPVQLVARFARELARYLVETFEEPPPGGVELLEPAIDLATVFAGFGVFLANASIDAGAGDLNEGERVHALAFFCRLRGVAPESLEAHLNPHLRKYLRLATLDLAQYDARFRRLRSERSAPPDLVTARGAEPAPRNSRGES